MHLIASSGLSLDPIAKPIAAILAAIYSVVPNYGVAILVLSLAWMIIIAPLTLKTTRSMLAMQKLQPQIKKLQEQHRNDRAALSQATMDLYKEHNVSPFGSCLPTLLPLPVFFALFRVIDGLSRTHTVAGKVVAEPKYLSQSTKMYHDIFKAGGHLNAFGVDLSKNALSSHASIASALPYFLLLLIMMGTQYAQTVQMMNRNPANADNPQAKMMKFIPLIFGVICIRFPAGVVLYYGMSNVCRIAQQTLMYRFDPKVKALAAQDIREIEAETRDIESGKRKREAPSAGLAGSTPAPRSRFRDLLANAAEQSAKAKEEREAAKGRTPPKGAPTPPKSGAKGSLPAKSAPAKGSNGAKAANGSKAPAKANGKPAPVGSTRQQPSSNGRPAANGKGTPVNGQRGNGASGGMTNGAGTNGARTNGAGTNGAGTNGAGTTTNGNGTATNGSGTAPAGSNDNGNGSGAGSDRPRTGAGAGAGGRTGAARGPRTNRKRRGR